MVELEEERKGGEITQWFSCLIVLFIKSQSAKQRVLNILNNFSRTQVEVLLDNLEQLRVRFDACAVSRDEDGKWFSNTDRIWQLSTQYTHTVTDRPRSAHGGPTIQYNTVHCKMWNKHRYVKHNWIVSSVYRLSIQERCAIAKMTAQCAL